MGKLLRPPLIYRLASPLPSILVLSFLAIAGSGCAKDEDTHEARLARANERLGYADLLLKTGYADAGKAILEEINRKIPDYLPSRVYLMRIACAKAQDEDCTARVQNILAQDSINYDALLQDGVLNLAKGDTVKAIREFEQPASIYSQNPQVRYQLALAYLQFAKTATPVNSRNAIDSADSNLSTAVKLAPQFEQAAVLLAELKIRKGTPAAAVDLLVPMTRDRPQVAQAHYLLATAYLAQQNQGQALAVYRKMTELFPQDPQPQFLIGTILLTQNQPQDARQAFEKSVAASTNYLPAIGRLVDLDVVEQKFASALERVQAQIDRDPKLAQAWALRGRIYLAQRDFTHAEPDLLKAIELDANLQPAYVLLGQVYVATDQPDKAIDKLKTFREEQEPAR
jgi:tetratricopeptide (TPR) repeat protein